MNIETNSFLNEVKCVVLNDKTEILLNDENDISISFICDGKIINTLEIPYPLGGYGGGSLYLSPSKSYLLFWHYSGQSEESFTLYKISDDKLEIVFEELYLNGEAANYDFSPNEEFLIQSLPISCTQWDWKYYVEECDFAEKDENNNLFFVFGYINILDIANKTLSQHQIRIYPSESAENFSKESYNPFIPLEMVDASTLKISMPWGEETLNLPLEDILVFHI